MRSLRFALLATALAASTAFASPADPKNGVDYVTLAQPQPVQATGKKVELSVSVDPELLGGVVAKIGSTVYDGSVKTQLQCMRQELVQR